MIYHDKNGLPIAQDYTDYLYERLADPAEAAVYLMVCAEDDDPELMAQALADVAEAKRRAEGARCQKD